MGQCHNVIVLQCIAKFVSKKKLVRNQTVHSRLTGYSEFSITLHNVLCITIHWNRQ